MASSWADWQQLTRSLLPRQECKRAISFGGPWVPGTCKCSGHSNGGPLLANLEMVDLLHIPEATPPGAYVLQWRYDCEETDQIWASCADVTITA